jgi:hypothetical protein
MAGPPRTPTEARRWAREAVIAKRYDIAVVHWPKRVGERGIALADALNAIRMASWCEPYSSPPEHGGTCWRIAGPALDGTPKKKATMINVGFEAFEDMRGEVVILVTVFNPGKKGGIL